MNVFSSVEPGEATLEESTGGKGWWDHGQDLGQTKFRGQVEKERAPRGLRGGRNPWGRRNIRSLDATEAWKKWDFKEAGAANSVTWCCRVKEDENGKWTIDHGDVETMVTVMRVTSAELGKEDGFDWLGSQRRGWRSGDKVNIFSSLVKSCCKGEQKNIAVNEERDRCQRLFKRDSRACLWATGTDPVLKMKQEMAPRAEWRKREVVSRSRAESSSQTRGQKGQFRCKSVESLHIGRWAFDWFCFLNEVGGKTTAKSEERREDVKWWLWGVRKLTSIRGFSGHVIVAIPPTISRIILINKLLVCSQAQIRTALWNTPPFPLSPTSL